MNYIVLKCSLNMTQLTNQLMTTSLKPCALQPFFHSTSSSSVIPNEKVQNAFTNIYVNSESELLFQSECFLDFYS